MVFTIADWAMEYNELSSHPVLEIPPELEVLYSSSWQARGQFPLHLTLEEISSTDVWIWSQARWNYLCAILFGRKTHWSSALVLHIMDRVNQGLPEHCWVEWTSIVGSTAWLAAWDHMMKEELDQFYKEPLPDITSDLEVATEEVYTQSREDAAQWEGGNQPAPPSQAKEE